MRFADVIGHEELKKKLVHACNEGRISHAQQFLGPEGCGNLALAIAYASYLLCENKSEDDSCGSCPSCVKVKKLVHPDLTFTYPVAPKGKIDKPKSSDFASEWREAVLENPWITYHDWVELLDIENKQGIIAVEEAKDIIARLSLKAVEGGFKIVIIWLPETMNAPTANKLLKIIEEPPDKTVFLLVSQQYDLVMPTISSRTQLIKVKRLSEKEIEEALVQNFGKEAPVARHLAHRAEGSFSEALRMINHEEETQNLDQWYLNWMRACYTLNMIQIGGLTQEFKAGSRELQKGQLQHALNITRECMMINFGPKSLIKIEGKELEDFTRFAQFITMNNCESFYQEMNEAIYHLERNANSGILFTDLSLKIHKLLRAN